MNLTYKTVSTWTSAEDIINHSYNRNAFWKKVNEMIDENKTDGVLITHTDLSFERHWINKDAAEEFVNFVSNGGLPDHGYKFPTFRIEPL